jgi:outer membrane protein TolC
MTLLAPVALALALAQAPSENPPPAVPDAAPPVAAQSATVLTLDDALRLADERNLDLKAAAARLRQAQEATSKAWAGYLPQVTAQGSYTVNEKEAAIPFPVRQEPAPDLTVVFAPITVVPKEQLAGQVEATQVLFSPALWHGIRAASRGADAAELNIAGARRDILFGTAQAFYGVASLRQAVQVSERLLEIAQRQEKDARVRFQAGAIAKVGLLRAEIDRARAEQDLRRARNSYESARIGLATLLDRPVDFEVADPPEPKLVPDPVQLQADALRDRTDVRAARKALESARAARSAQIGRYFPDIAAFGRYQVADVAGLTGQKDAWAAGLSLQWRIFDGGLRESDLRESSARVDEAEANLASAESRTSAEVRQALLDLESARANAEKAREQRDLAAENQRLVDVSFRAGAATAVEQADATAQLRTAELAQQAEALGAQLSALRVLRVAGASLR